MTIAFIKTKDSSKGEQALIDNLAYKLETGSQVLWIVSGGSNMTIEVRVMQAIKTELTNKLQIMLADERYGIEGHPDSNYTQLVKAGFDSKNAQFDRVLVHESSIEQCLDRFSQQFSSKLAWADEVIGQLGIGDDGHTAGVLPGSIGTTSQDNVVYYEANYRRLTLSLKALMSLNQVYVFCFGDSKKPALKRLQSGNESILDLPSMIFQEVANVKLYNDQIGD